MAESANATTSKFEFPTEIIELPSKGLIYPKNSPLSKGTVEIKYMTAREEDILASQNLIKKVLCWINYLNQLLLNRVLI